LKIFTFTPRPWAEDGGGDFRARHEGVTELHGVAVRNHQHLVEDNLSANVCRYLFYFDFFAGGNSILLAAGFYDRVHCRTPKGCECFPRHFPRGRQGTRHDTQFPRKVKDLTPGLSGSPATLEGIRITIEEDLSAVDAVIRRRLESSVALIRTIADYILGSGGKRLRPALVLLTANAFGARARPSTSSRP
jgi:octaprenyl-diphosphate synthase